MRPAVAVFAQTERAQCENMMLYSGSEAYKSLPLDEGNSAEEDMREVIDYRFPRNCQPTCSSQQRPLLRARTDPRSHCGPCVFALHIEPRVNNASTSIKDKCAGTTP